MIIKNKDKLKKAEEDHDKILERITKRFAEFNIEGIEDIYFDLLSFMSTVGSQMINVSTKVSNYLYENFSTTEIVLAREIQTKKKSKEFEESQGDSKKIWLDHLIE